VPLSLQNRRVGDITVIECEGRIVEGAENSALQRQLNDALVWGSDIVLNLSNVSFIDSSGLGLLVRYVSRARSAHGNLKLCGVDPHVQEVLRVTKLNTLLETHATEEEAIADFYTRAMADSPEKAGTSILCVEPSLDVLAYVRELLKRSGYAVSSVTNLPDALTLVRAARPKLIVINAGLRALRATQAADNFNRIADQLPVVELPSELGGSDPVQVGQELLERIRPMLEGHAASGA